MYFLKKLNKMNLTIKFILKKILNILGLLKFLVAFRKKKFALKYYRKKLDLINKWSFQETEDFNFNYHLTKYNLDSVNYYVNYLLNKDKDFEIKKYRKFKSKLRLTNNRKAQREWKNRLRPKNILKLTSKPEDTKS